MSGTQTQMEPHDVQQQLWTCNFVTIIGVGTSINAHLNNLQFYQITDGLHIYGKPYIVVKFAYLFCHGNKKT